MVVISIALVQVTTVKFVQSNPRWRQVGLPTRKEEDFRHTCSLCMEPYRGRCPKILPCFHTFCLPCLTALQDSVTLATPKNRREEENQPTEDEDQKQPDSNSDEGKKQDTTSEGDDVTNDRIDDVEKSVFLCPSCRAPVSIPEGGVAALQTNFYLDHEASADEAPPPVLCDLCDEGNRQHAAHACQQCQMKMCRTCRGWHDKLMRDHVVTPLSVGQPVMGKLEKKGMCLVHQDQALCLHCRQCDISICLYCKLTAHEGHVTADLASVVLQAKEEVTSLATTAQQQLQVVETSLRRVDRDERKLTRHKQEVTQQINARYDALMTWATRSRDELLEEVSAKEDSARSQLRAEKTAATVTMETLSALVSRASRVTGKDLDVVSLRNELRAALLSEDGLDHHRQRAERQEPVWGWRYDVTEASVLQLEVVQAYMGRVVEGGRADVTRPLSLRELSDKVDRLMNEMTETNNNITAITTNITANTNNISSCRDDVTSLKKSEIELQEKTASLTADMKTVKKKEAAAKKTTSSVEENMEKAGRTVVFCAICFDETKSQCGKATIFKYVTVNEGDCYDDTTGVFTTTVPGTYVFTATMRHAKKDALPIYIMVDGTDYAVLCSTSTSVGSNSVSVQLGLGQRVWVMALDHCFDASSLFTGVLAQPQL